MLSGNEFERAGDFAKAARAHPVCSIEYKALLQSSIHFYARPSDNKSKKSKLSGRRWSTSVPRQGLVNHPPCAVLGGGGPAEI
jgi:hypothetical protein